MFVCTDSQLELDMSTGKDSNVLSKKRRRTNDYNPAKLQYGVNSSPNTANNIVGMSGDTANPISNNELIQILPTTQPSVTHPSPIKLLDHLTETSYNHGEHSFNEHGEHYVDGICEQCVEYSDARASSSASISSDNNSSYSTASSAFVGSTASSESVNNYILDAYMVPFEQCQPMVPYINTMDHIGDMAIAYPVLYYYGYGYPYNSYSYTVTSPTVGQKRKATHISLPDDQRDVVSSYPKELTDMFQPLFCVLCNSRLNSNTTALMHYSSKNHKKKVNKYLDDWAERTGEPLPKKLFIDQTKPPNDLFCEPCDLRLTSKMHAKQHYIGKRHQMVVAGKKQPAGSGYYNHEGKWIRQEKAVVDATGRFGIGAAFAIANATNNTTTPSAACTPATSAFTPDNEAQLPREEPRHKDTDLYCSLCDVHVTSYEQMVMHLAGARHHKNVKKYGNVNKDEPEYVPTEVLHPPVDNILSSVMRPNLPLSASLTEPSDISIFRTPSGKYYCRPCDLVVENEPQFRQHIASKRHNKTFKLPKKAP